MPDAIDAQVRLVQLRLARGQSSAALAAATRLVEQQPENALAVETLGQAEASANHKPQAIKHLRDAARYAGVDGEQLLRIATRQIALADHVEARRTLVKALESPAATEAVAALVRLEIAMGEYDSAQQRIAAFRTD